jgi:hypothetical protein
MSRIVAYCPPGRKVTSAITLALRGEQYDELAESPILVDSSHIILCTYPDEPSDIPPLPPLIDWTPLDQWRIVPPWWKSSLSLPLRSPVPERSD